MEQGGGDSATVSAYSGSKGTAPFFCPLFSEVFLFGRLSLWRLLLQASQPCQAFFSELVASAMAPYEPLLPEATKTSKDPVDYDAQFNLKPATKHGPQGGRYTEGKTKDGRPYRRYF